MANDARSKLPMRLTIDTVFSLRVLTKDKEQTLSCSVVTLDGRRLVAKLPTLTPLDTAVQIDCDDAFLLGEIVGSWREGSEIFAAIELQQAVTGLRQLASLRDQFLDDQPHSSQEAPPRVDKMRSG